MEHRNHKLSEVVITFFYEEDVQKWDLSTYSDLLSLMKSQGYRAEQRQPVIIELLAPEPEQEIIETQVQRETPTILFTSESGTRALWIGPAFTSFHALNNYSSWQEFWHEFVVPTRAACNSTIVRGVEQRATMIYVNELSVDNGKQLADFFVTGLLANTFGNGPEIESVSKHLFRPEPHLDLKISTQMQSNLIEGHKRIRVEILAGAPAAEQRRTRM